MSLATRNAALLYSRLRVPINQRVLISRVSSTTKLALALALHYHHQRQHCCSLLSTTKKYRLIAVD